MHALTGWQMRAKPQFIMVSCQAEYELIFVMPVA